MKTSIHGQKGSYAVFADGERVTTNRFSTQAEAKRWAAEYKAAIKNSSSNAIDDANYARTWGK